MDNKERMQIIATNITKFRKEKGITQKELAKRIGIQPSTLSDYINLRSAPSFGIIQKLADFFGVNKSDIDTTFKETEQTSTTLQAIQSLSERLLEPRRVIVLDTAKKQLKEQERAQREVTDILYSYNYYDHPASAGTGQYLTDVAVERIDLPLDVDADFVIPISGDSMEPDYHDGDYLFVKLSLDLADGDIGVFYYNGDAYIKQLIIDDQKAHLHSLNPEYPDKPITADTDFRIIGEVVAAYRDNSNPKN